MPKLLTAFEIYRVPSEAALRAFWGEWHVKHYGKDLTASDKSLRAYVNAGRWLADCPICNNGIGLHPLIQQACCIECGIVFGVTFPPAGLMAEAERLLLLRPVAARNWYPNDVTALPRGRAGESIDQLEKENKMLLGTVGGGLP